MGTICDELASRGPIAFSREDLESQAHLFAHRAALFYTPTESIPSLYIGNADVDITIPIVTPDYTTHAEIRAYGSPRLWVDLLQQQSGKLRWTTLASPCVRITRYDLYIIRTDHLAISNKALIDALKVRTTGRRDGRELFYFGAIVDDGPNHARIVEEQALVDHPREARVRVQVSQSQG